MDPTDSRQGTHPPSGADGGPARCALRLAARVVGVRPAGAEHQVVSVEMGDGSGIAPGQYRRRPCGGCPWRVDQTGVFPPEAFEHSAETAYDLSQRRFGCHESGVDRPLTCAGFLLRGAEHNLAVRMALVRGDLDLDQVHDGGLELHEGYRQMAVANGVDPDHPRLRPCR